MTTKTIEVTLPQEQYERLTRVAKERDQSPAELLGNLAVEFLETAKDEAANYRAIAEAADLRIRHPQLTSA